MGFDELVGQESVIRVLKDSVKNDNLSHAILFSGPKGSGKQTLSAVLAKALNCVAENAPCDNCLSCRNIMRGEHPDVAVIEPDGRWIKINQIREVKKRFFYFSHGSGTRVCIIKDSHNLKSEAAASLLKILEDPPPRLIFLLTTPYPSMLPSTILSRCQQFKMQRLSRPSIKELLLKTGEDFSAEELNLAVNLGEGIPGRSLNILNDPLWKERQELVLNAGKKMVEGLFTETDSIDEAKKWSTREDVGYLLELLAYFLKDGLFWNIYHEKDMLSFPFLHSYWGRKSIADSVLKECLEELNILRKNLRTNINLNLAIETFFLQITGRLQENA